MTPAVDRPRWLPLVAMILGVLGFAMSRAYPIVRLRWGFIALDYFLAVAMSASHFAFLLAVFLLVRRYRSGSRSVALPTAALALALLTYVWVP